LQKREFVKNISSSDVFQVERLECNPGLAELFPWLSGIAPNFEKYKFHSLRFVYETSQSTFVPGTVMYAPEFNVLEDPPETKTALLEYAYASRSPVWKNFVVAIPVSAIMTYKEYYVRTGPISSGDLKTYDPLYWIIAVDGVPDTAGLNIGELWVEYDIEFYYPQRIDRSQLNLQYYHSFRVNSSEGFNTDPLGTAIEFEQGAYPISLVQSPTQGEIHFPEGFSGLFIYTVYGTTDGENIGFTNLWTGATLSGVTLFVNYGTHGENLGSTAGQVTYTTWLVAEPNGFVHFVDNGYNHDNPTLGAILIFYQNVHIPTGLTSFGTEKVSKDLKKKISENRSFHLKNIISKKDKK
jgi:hypothetical protein